MRTNWDGNRALQDRVLAADSDARVYVEALAVARDDVKDTRDDWAGSDAVSGVNVLDDGGVRLGGTVGTAADHTVATANVFTDLDTVEPFDVVEIHWSRFGGHLQELDRVTVRVDPDVAATGVEVTEWRAQLLRVHRDSTVGLDPITDRILELVAISNQVRVPHTGGAAVQDIVFNFRSLVTGTPVVAGPPPVGGQEPVTVLMVWALKGQGERADNVALLGDAAATKFDGPDYSIRARRYDIGDTPAGANRGGIYQDTLLATGGLPRVLVERINFAAQTVAFTQAGNRLDLGAVPTEPVEVVAQGQVFGDSSLTWELAIPGSGTWVEVVDGDLIGQDNTPQGGKDLTGLALRQDYDARVTLSPGVSTYSGPIARRFGISEREATLFSDGVEVVGLTYQTDPVTMKTGVAMPTIRFLRGGEVDYRDEVTRLLSEHHRGALEFRVWIGHPTLARSQWLHVDSFLVEDWDSPGAAVEVRCLDVLGEANALVPAVLNNERSPVPYADNLRAVYEDVRDGQIGMAPRRVGPGILDATTAVSRTLREERGKVTLDALAMVAGGTNLASQGRLVYRHMFDDVGEPAPNPVAMLPMDEVAVTGMTPGFRSKVPEYFVPYGYTEGANGARGRFRGESRTFHAESLTKLGVANVEPLHRIDQATAEWIPDQALGDAIGNRVVRTMGMGILVASCRSAYPNPHIEVGDVVSIETDRLVVKDPLTDQPLRGRAIMTGRVITVEGVWGRGLQVWVQSYANIIPGSEDVDRPGWGTPGVGAIAVSVDASGMASAILYGSPGTASWQWAVTVEDLDEAEGLALALAGTVVPGPTARLESILQLEVGQRATVWAVAWSGPDATGTRTDVESGHATFQSRGLGKPPDVQTHATAAGNTGTFVVDIRDPDLTLFRQDGQDMGQGVFFETDPPDPSKPDEEATYVQQPAWVRLENDVLRFTWDYDISGGAVVARVNVRYDTGAGLQHIYRSQLIEPNPLPELTQPWADVQFDGQLMVAAEVDADTSLIYTAIRLDRPPTTSEILADPDPKAAPVGGGFWYWSDTGVFPDYGARIFVGNIPTGPGGTPQGAEVQRSYQRDHEAPTIENIILGALPDLSQSVVLQGKGKKTKTFFYAASKQAMPLDNPAQPYPLEEQPDTGLNKVRSIVSGFHTHIGGTNPEFGNYTATLGYDMNGNLRQAIIGPDGDVLAIEAPTDTIYIRVWPADAVQRWMDELNPPRTDVDHSKPGAPGESREITLGPFDMTPSGRTSITQPVDAYGNVEWAFLGGRFASSVSYKIVHAGGYQPDPETIIPSDDPATADGTLNLDYEPLDTWEAFGAAYLPQVLAEGYTAIKTWWHFERDGGGETVVAPVITVLYQNRSTARLLTTAAQMSNVATPHLVDAFLRVVDDTGKAMRVRVWVNKAGLTDPDLSGDPDGYYDIPANAGIVQLGPGTVFDLTGGGTDTLLAGITVRGTDGKIGGVELMTMDAGTPIGTSFADEWHITPQGATVDENSNWRSDGQWTDLQPVQKTKDGGEKADDTLPQVGHLIDGIALDGDGWIPEDKDIQTGTPGVPVERPQQQAYSGSAVVGLVNRNERSGYCAGPVTWGTQNIYQEGSYEPVLVDGQRLTGVDFLRMLTNINVGDTAGLRIELLETDANQITTVLASKEVLYPGVPADGVYYPDSMVVNHVVSPTSKYRVIVGFKALLGGSGVQSNKFHLGGFTPTYGKSGAFNAP